MKKLLAIFIVAVMLMGTLHIGVYASGEVFATDDWAYPTEVPTLTWEGQGTEAEPYLIDTAQELADLAYMVNNEDVNYYGGVYFELAANIDLNPGFSASESAFLGEGTPKQWIPIGEVRVDDDVYTPFCGVFNGNGYTVKGIYMADESCARDAVGMFGYLNVLDENTPSAVKNLNITNSYIVSDESYTSGYECTAIGTVVALNCSTVDSCHVTDTYLSLNSSEYGYFMGVGGIVSDNNSLTSQVLDCSFDGKVVYLGDYAPSMAGIVASNNGYVEGCTNYADVDADTDRVGGIVGTNRGEADIEGTNSGVIKRCVNYGNITGQYKVGGIAGHSSWKSDMANAGTAVIDCTNFGDVTADRVVSDLSDSYSSVLDIQVGGIVGLGYDVEINNCYNHGKVLSSASAADENDAEKILVNMGGIIGGSSDTQISYCYNYGEIVTSGVTLPFAAGALAGKLSGTYAVSNNRYLQDDTVNTGLDAIDVIATDATGSATENKKFASLDDMTLSTAFTELEKGKTVTLSIVGVTVPTDEDIIWSSTNEEVATVQDGVVTAIGEGEATIAINVLGYSATWKVRVIAQKVGLEGAEINDNGELVLKPDVGEDINLGVVVGADGENGTNGIDGEDGADGINGTNGIDGKNGVDGKDGVNGANGKDGINGADGKDGANGVDGAAANNTLVVVSLVVAIVALLGNAVMVYMYFKKNKA